MIQSALLTALLGVKHGFADAHDPSAAWPGPRPIWKQVHGVHVAEVTGPAQAVGDADGLRTALFGVPIGIVTADCVPILLARRDGQEVAALHAGWRGTRAGIVPQLARALTAAAQDPRDWIAAIGPAAGPCCYEVSEELARDFTRAFGAFAVPAPRRLDLPAVNEAQLRAAGFGAVEILRHCTICERVPGGNFRFHSYRRDQTKGRQRSQIALS